MNASIRRVSANKSGALASCFAENLISDGGIRRYPILSRELIESAPCDVLLLRASQWRQPNRQDHGCRLGGPHARGIKHANRLAADTNARVRALYVQRHSGEDAAAVGRSILDKELSKAGLEHETRIDRRSLTQRLNPQGYC